VVFSRISTVVLRTLRADPPTFSMSGDLIEERGTWNRPSCRSLLSAPHPSSLPTAGCPGISFQVHPTCRNACASHLALALGAIMGTKISDQRTRLIPARAAYDFCHSAMLRRQLNEPSYLTDPYFTDNQKVDRDGAITVLFRVASGRFLFAGVNGNPFRPSLTTGYRTTHLTAGRNIPPSCNTLVQCD
jgi:hypothetical protein